MRDRSGIWTRSAQAPSPQGAGRAGARIRLGPRFDLQLDLDFVTRLERCVLSERRELGFLADRVALEVAALDVEQVAAAFAG